jgi:hypothetical protein
MPDCDQGAIYPDTELNPMDTLHGRGKKSISPNKQ